MSELKERRRLKLDYDFNERPNWHQEAKRTISIPAYVDYINAFLSWYHSLSESVVKEIQSANIFKRFELEFVHKMCTQEGEGEQEQKAVVEAIRHRNPKLMKDPKECITCNMYCALILAKGSTNGAQKHDFHVSFTSWLFNGRLFE